MKNLKTLTVDPSTILSTIFIQANFMKTNTLCFTGDVHEERTKFIDLPDFCLDRILTNFSLKDLAIVGDTSISLSYSANRVFKTNFKNKEIAFYTQKYYEKYRFRGSKSEQMVEKIESSDELSTILHRFGSLIKKLSIVIRHQHIFDEFLDKCNENLIELNLMIKLCDLQLTRPFENLKKLKLLTESGYCVSPSWRDINRYFPKVYCLEIEDYNELFTIEKDFIGKIPNLVEFSYSSLKDRFNEETQKLERISQFINVNDQITTLRLHGDLKDFNDLGQHIRWDNLKLKYLDVSVSGIIDVSFFAKLNYLRSLKISACDLIRISNGPILPALDTLSYVQTIEPFIEDTIQIMFEHFVHMNPLLKNFNFICEERMYAIELIAIVRSLKILLDRLEHLQDIKIYLKRKYSCDEYKRIDSIAETEFPALRQHYRKRPLNLNFVCSDRANRFNYG